MSADELAQMQNTNRAVEDKPLFRLMASPILKGLHPKSLYMLSLMFQLTTCCKAGKMAGLK